MSKEDVFSSISYVVSWAGACEEINLESRTFLIKQLAIDFYKAWAGKPSLRIEEVLSVIKVKKLSEKEFLL